MAANDDFFVRFGSNAKTFAGELIRDLAPARAVVSTFLGDLQALEAQSLRTKAALAKTLPQGGVGVRGTDPSLKIDTSALMHSLDVAGDEIKTVVQNLASAAAALKKVAQDVGGGRSGGQVRSQVQGGQGRWYVPGQSGYVKAADVAAGKHPAAVQIGSDTWRILKGLGPLLERVSRATPPGRVASVGEVTKVQIDEAGITRIVTAVGRVEAAVDRLAERGVAVSGARATTSGGAKPTTTSTTGSVNQVTAQTNQAESQVSQLERDAQRIAELEVKMARAVSLLAKSAAGPREQIQGVIQELQGELEAAKAEAAKAERQTTGKTRGQQSAERRAAAQAQYAAMPELPAEVRDLLKLVPVNHPESWQEAISGRGTGAGEGKLTKENLLSIAQALTTAGFSPGVTPRMSKADIGERVFAARQNMVETFGTTAPGRLLREDKISPEVQSLLGEINKVDASVIDHLEAARSTLREFWRSGGVIQGTTLPQWMGGGAAKGLRVNAAGESSNAFGPYDERAKLAMQAFQQNRDDISRLGLSRAIHLVGANPDINVYDPSLRAGITGTGDQARRSHSALSAIQRATDELDNLGRQWLLLGDAMKENEKFIDRARSRIAQGTPKPTDEQKLEEALQYRQRLTSERAGVFQDPLNPGQNLPQTERLKQLFNSPQYETFLGHRDVQRHLEEQRRMELSLQSVNALGTFMHRGDLIGGMAQAVGGGRLAAGTADTLIRAIPGISVTGRGTRAQIAFADKERNPRELDEVNKANRSLAAAVQRLSNLEKNLGNFDKKLGEVVSNEHIAQAARRVETKGAAFLTELEQVFSIVPRLEQLLGRPISADLAPNEQARQARVQAATLTESPDAGAMPWEQRIQNQNERLKQTQAQVAEVQAQLKAVETDIEAKRASGESVVIGPERSQLRAQLADLQERANVQKAGIGATELQRLRSQVTQAQRAHAEALGATGTEPEQQRLEREQQILAIEEKLHRLRAQSATEAARIPTTFANSKTQVPWDIQEQIKKVQELRAAPPGAPYNVDSLDQPRTMAEELRRSESQLAKMMAEWRKAAGIQPSGTDKQIESLRAQREALTVPFRSSEQATQIKSTKAALDAAAKEYESALTDLDGVVKRALEKSAQKLGDVAKAAETETKQVSETDARIERLRAEQTRLQAGPHTKKQIEAAIASGASEEDVAAIRTAKSRLTEIRKELRQLQGAAGGNGAGGTGGIGGASGVPRGGRGGDDLSVLRQILAKLNEIHATIKGGIKVTERGTSGGRSNAARTYASRQTATLAELNMANSGDAEQVARAQIQQQRRLERLRPSDISRAYDQAVQEDTRRTQSLQRAEEGDAAAAREAARAKVALESAMALVSVAATRELAELSRLNSEGADATQIAYQQAKAYAAVNESLKQGGVGVNDRRAISQRLLSANGPEVGGAEMNSIMSSAKPIVQAGRNVDEALASQVEPGGGSAFEKALSRMFGQNGFWSRVMSSTGTFIVRNFTAGFVFGLTNALQEIMRQAINTEQTFIRVSNALEQTGRSVGSLRSDLQQVSTDLGVSLNDVYDTAAGLTGLFDTTKEISGATRVVAELQKISDGALTAQEAMGVLASTVGGFGDSIGSGVGGLQHVADVLTVIQNTIGTNIEITSEGVGRMSGLARQLHLSYEQTAVYVAQIAKLTNQSGGAAGEQFSRILASMQTGRGQTALVQAFSHIGGRQTPEIGAALRGNLEQGQFGKVLATMSQNWDKLTDAQKRYVSTAVAGQRQAAAFAALMNSGAKSLDVINRAMYAHGEAENRIKELMKTLNGELSRLHTNFQNLANNLVRSGVLDFVGLLLRAVDLTLSALNSVLTKINDIADSNGLLRFIKEAGFGFLGMALTIGIVSKAVKGLMETIGEMKGVQAAQSVPLLGGVLAKRASNAVEGVASTPISRVPFYAFGNPQARWEQGSVGAPLSRATGFALDRTVGIPIAHVGQGLTRLGTAIDGSREKLISETGARASLLRVLSRVGMPVRYAGTGVTGFAGGARAVFQGQGEQYFADLSTRLGNAGAGYRTRASLANLDVGRVISGSLGREVEGEMGRGMTLQSAKWGMLARSTELASKGAGGLSKTMGALAGAGAMADVALAAVVIGIGLWAENMKQTAELARENADNFKQFSQALGSGGQTTADQRNRAAYVGPNTQAWLQNTSSMRGPGSSWWSAGLHLAPTIVGHLITGDWSGRLGTNAAAGLTNDGTQIYGHQFAQNLVNHFSRRMQDFNLPGVAFPRGRNGSNALSAAILHQSGGLGDTSEQILNAQKAAEKQIQKRLHQIQNDDSLSEQQKQAAASQLEQANKIIGDMAARQAAIADGLKASMVLNGDQVQQVLTLIQMAQTTGGRTKLSKNGPDISGINRQLLYNTGVGKDSPIYKQLQNIQDSGGNQIQSAQAALKVINVAIKNMKNNWRAQLHAGNEDAASTDWQNIQSLIQQYVSTGQQIVQRQTESLNSTYGLRTSQAAGQLQQDRLNKEKAQKNLAQLRADRQRYGGLRVTANQIKDAEAQVFAASLGLARDMNSLQVARIASQAAATWSESGKAALAVKQAQAQLAFAQRHHDKLGIQQGRQAINSAIQSQQQLADQQAQAQMAASIAGIPQGNAVAVAGAQVTAAQQALAQAKKYGTNSTEYQNALSQLYQAQQGVIAAQNGVSQAQASLSQAYSEASGDARKSAQASLHNAQVALASALQASGGAMSSDVIQAQAQIVAANAAIDQAQLEFIQSKVQVSIALATAAGHTVRAAVLQVKVAQQALDDALKRNGGQADAASNQAKAQLIQAQAAARDAVLQNQEDTIDFNLQMGRITQASAIAAMRHILKTEDLTRQQRRDLLLKIKGMQNELSQSPWNFGDIKLPTPYQMRRYVEQHRKGLQKEIHTVRDAMLKADAGAASAGAMTAAVSAARTIVNNHHDTKITNNFKIDGADIAKVRKVIQEVVGTPARTRTAAPRRRL